MPYAGKDRISDDEFEGSVYISKPAAVRAIEAMVAGKRVEVHGKTMKLVDPEPFDPEPPEPDAEQKRQLALGAIKRAVSIRIHNVMSDTAQRNALAAQQEAILTHGPYISEWPPEARAEAEADLAKWAEIRRLRARSNELEAMEPLPENPDDDQHWI